MVSTSILCHSAVLTDKFEVRSLFRRRTWQSASLTIEAALSSTRFQTENGSPTLQIGPATGDGSSRLAFQRRWTLPRARGPLGGPSRVRARPNVGRLVRVCGDSEFRTFRCHTRMRPSCCPPCH